MFDRPAQGKPKYARGIPETWWYDPGQSDANWSGEVSDSRHAPFPLERQASNLDGDLTIMGAYILRRLLLMIPTLFGIMLVSFVVVQFAPGGPVERVIAQLSGSDTGATSRISGSPGGDFGRRGGAEGASAIDGGSSKYRGAQGLDPEFIKQLEKQFGFDKPAYERFLDHAVELSSASISARAISAT